MKNKKLRTTYIAVLLMVALIVLVFASTASWTTAPFSSGYGPGFYPRVLAVALGILSALLLIVENVNAAKADKSSEPEDKEEAFDISQLKNPAIFIGMMIAYTILIKYLGFIIDTIVFLFGGMMILKAKPVISAIISVIFALVIYFVFGGLLHVQLPACIFF